MIYKTVVVKKSKDGNLPFQLAETEDGVIVKQSDLVGLGIGTKILGVMGSAVNSIATFETLAKDRKFTMDIEATGG